MDLSQRPEVLDRAAFRRVWQRVMPQDRPDCPFTLDPAPADSPARPEGDPAQSPPFAGGAGALVPRPNTPAPLCLGPASTGDLKSLDLLTAQVSQDLTFYRSLTRRASPALALARTKADHLRQLAAARYLISGQKPSKSGASAAKSGANGPLPPLLRERFHAEEGLVLSLFTAAGSAADPCLQELYRQLAPETQELAEVLRRWLERILL